jgi:hypothetical protein
MSKPQSRATLRPSSRDASARSLSHSTEQGSARARSVERYGSVRRSERNVPVHRRPQRYVRSIPRTRCRRCGGFAAYDAAQVPRPRASERPGRRARIVLLSRDWGALEAAIVRRSFSRMAAVAGARPGFRARSRRRPAIGRREGPATVLRSRIGGSGLRHACLSAAALERTMSQPAV